MAFPAGSSSLVAMSLFVKEIIYSVGLLIGEEVGVNTMMMCIFNIWVSSLLLTHCNIFFISC